MLASPVSTVNVDYIHSSYNSTPSYYEQLVDSGESFTNNHVTTTSNRIFIFGKTDFSQVNSLDIKDFDYSDEFHKMIVEKTWVVSFLQNASQLDNVKSLLPYYKEINQLMIEDQFQACDVFLKNIRVKELSDVLLVGLLRLTYSRKDHLNTWVDFLEKCEKELTKRGHDSYALLKGLS